MISTSQRWRKTALASLVAALFGLSGSNASALALGRISVLSALGEPLRAEIDIPEINAEEASSLRSSVALPEAFKAAGLDYNAALTGVQITLQRRADGRAYLRLASDRPISEPFVDLILEASWATGRIVRDYTMLLDPPNLRAAAPASPSAPQVSTAQVSPPASIAARPAPQPAPAPLPAPAAAPSPRTAAPAAARPAAPVVRAPATAAAESPARSPASADGKLVVRPGDTASKIARSIKPAQVSLDQMLVALLRSNEDAFINGNLNRLKAGAVLNVPSADEAQSVSATEASRLVIAQSKDFNDFRGRLASNAPNQQVATGSRQVGGSVQTQVEDRKTATPTPDKLTLSKSSVQAKAAEAKVAQDKAAQEAAQRAAELAKNIRDLSSISAAASAASGPAAAGAPAAAAPAPAAPTAPMVVAGNTPVAAAPSPAPAATASTPDTASVPATPVASAPAAQPPASSAVPAVRPPVANPTPVQEESFLDSLLGNPTILVAAGALLALLAGLGIYKSRQRRKTADVDSAFLESRLQPDSFFGASGGQRVDTSDGAATGSSMVYSPSQLDAADDVDPVAEADVYLAYGRDIQAEEILKEALRTHPGRVAIHQKLLDIYAKRRDTQSFEAMANEAYKLTGENTPEWARICEQGLSIDPANPLYQPGGQPVEKSAAAAAGVVAALDATAPMLSSTATQKMDAMPAAAAPVDLDLDLDLDFSLDDEPKSSIVEAQPSQLEPTVAVAPVESANAPLDFDFGVTTEALKPPASSSQPLPVEVALPDISHANDTVAIATSETEEFRQQAEVSFGSTSPIPLQMLNSTGTPAEVDAPLPDVSFGYTSPSELTATQAPLNAPAQADSGMLEFDLGTLSLELEPPAAQHAAASAPPEPEDPLATKLALAEEFVSIGDDDGARALIEEVIAEASGDLKAKAQRALSSLS